MNELIFIESRVFERLREQFLKDAQYRLLQAAILHNPEIGVVIPGTNGLRKATLGSGGEWKTRRPARDLVPGNSRFTMLAALPVSQERAGRSRA